MTLNDNVIWQRHKYAVLSVTKTTAPSPADEMPWHKYIVGRSNTCLIGMARGTLEQVTEHAEKLAFDLNLRRDARPGHYSRHNNTYTNKRKKETA